MAVVAVVLTVGFIKRDHYVANKAADQLAMEEYLQKGKPNSSACNRIVQDVRFVRLLIEAKADLNKGRLIDFVDGDDKLKTFKLLIDGGASFQVRKDAISTLQRIFPRSSNEKIINHLMECIKNKKITINPQDYDVTIQVSLWEYCMTEFAARALIDLGFDPNVKCPYNGQEKTALEIVEANRVFAVRPRSNEIDETIRILKKYGTKH